MRQDKKQQEISVIFIYDKGLGITAHLFNLAVNINRYQEILAVYDPTFETADNFLKRLRHENVQVIKLTDLENVIETRYKSFRILFHCQGFTHLIIAQRLKRQNDAIVLTVHAFKGSLWYGKLFALYGFLRFRSVVDNWHFLSRKSRKEFFWFRSIRGNSCVFPLGLENRFMCVSSDRNSCIDIFGRKISGIANNTAIVYVADFNPGKRHLFLLRSLRKLLTGNTVLYLLGDGALLERAITNAKDLGILDNVVFMGRVDRDTVHYILSNANLAVVSSRSETFGWCLLEPFCMDIPIVTTNVGIAESLIDDYRNGFILEVNCSESDFAEKVKLALAHIKTVNNSLEKHSYDWKTTATLFNRCYDSAFSQTND